MGAEIVPFSLLHDRVLPEGIQGLYLPRGYPELHAGELSENVSMREDIKKKLQEGLPCIAECGGFLYLLASMWQAFFLEMPCIQDTSSDSGIWSFRRRRRGFLG